MEYDPKDTMNYDPQHDFAPLTAYLTRAPAKAHLPWQYMGQDGRSFYYREREQNNHIKINARGRFNSVHIVTGTDLVTINHAEPSVRHL